MHGTYIFKILRMQIGGEAVGRGTALQVRKSGLHFFVDIVLPALWSSGQSFWLQMQRSRVRFPALPDFLSSSGSGDRLCGLVVRVSG